MLSLCMVTMVCHQKTVIRVTIVSIQFYACRHDDFFHCTNVLVYTLLLFWPLVYICILSNVIIIKYIYSKLAIENSWIEALFVLMIPAFKGLHNDI